MFALLALFACVDPTPGIATDCIDDCPVVTTWPEAGDTLPPGRHDLTVTIDPDDHALVVGVYDADGVELIGGNDTGSVVVDPLLELGDHTLVVRYTCAPGPAEPCGELTVPFSVEEGADIPTPPATPPAEFVEEVFEVPVPKADILFAIDDSCSMFEEQFAISVSAVPMMEAVLYAGIDLHVGVVTTSPSDDGQLVAANGVSWVDNATPEPESTFTDMLLQGTGGEPENQALTTTKRALERANGGSNDGFARDDAQLFIVVITDGDDAGSLTPSAYADFIAALGRPKAQMAVVADFISPVEPPTRYLAAADLLGDPVEVQLDPNFGYSATSELDLSATGPQTYCLAEPPRRDTLQVFLTSFEVEAPIPDEQVSVAGNDPNCVTLDTTLLPGDLLRFSYQPLP